MRSSEKKSDNLSAKRVSIIKSGLLQMQQSKDTTERRKYSALVSIAAASSAIEDESLALRLLRVVDRAV